MYNREQIIPQRNPSIGIIGGGQLGKMIAQEAKRMSLKVIILDPDPECPASLIADDHLIADFKSQIDIWKLSQLVDVVTYEIELADSDVLIDINSGKKIIHPAPETLKIIQNKYRQKMFLKEKHLPVPTFALIEGKSQIDKALLSRGFPLIVKACEDSYDGRGNRVIHSEDELLSAARAFGSRKCMVEEIIDYKKELSVMVARNELGQVTSFPVVENFHSDSILDTTIAPARISKPLEIKARRVAEKAVQALMGSGIFCIEMFETRKHAILINEIAPRPHNSGHYTIEGCSVSQFEQHIRSILNLPITVPRLISPTVMVNILGPQEFEGEYYLGGLHELLSIEGLRLHLYGKRISKPKRKLGHITITSESLSDAIDKSKKAKTSLRIMRIT